MVYSIYSGEKGVSDRLMEVLRSNGIKAVELKSTVPVEKREEWIEQKDREGYQVLVTNPINVMTGLNIIQFPTIYFYETGFSTYVLRQSEVRHWRVNQKKPCKVFYSYYSDTLQEDAIKLIGGKKKKALKLEGVFQRYLSAMGGNRDDCEYYSTSLKERLSSKKMHLMPLGSWAKARVMLLKKLPLMLIVPACTS